MRLRPTLPLLPLALAAVTAACGGLGAAGCARKTPEAGSATAGPKPATPEEAKRFVATLRGLPPAQRPAYVAQHPGMAEGVNQSGDSRLIGEFMALMRPSGP